MRRGLLITSIVAALLGVPLLVVVLLRQPQIKKWLHPPQAELPDDSEIESMRATLYQLDRGWKPIDEFDVPPEHIPRILFWFRPSKYESQPPLHPGEILLGELKMTTKRGETRIVKFYWAGVNPPMFTENEVDYYYGGGTLMSGGHGVDGGMMVRKAIEQAHSETKKKTKG